jgi:hypothetical protein
MPPIDPRNIEVIDQEVANAIRSISAKESLNQALDAHELGRNLVESGVRSQHPDWSDQEVQIEIIRRMHGDAVATAAVRSRNA